MSHGDPKQDQGAAADDAATDLSAAEGGAELVPSEEAFQLDLEAGPILAELLESGVASDANSDDIHAAVASLSEEALEQLDPAAQHLIESVDLFDVPVGDTGEAG